MAREAELAKVAEEQAMLKQRWIEEKEAEANMATQTHLITRERNKENIEHNQ